MATRKTASKAPAKTASKAEPKSVAPRKAATPAAAKPRTTAAATAPTAKPASKPVEKSGARGSAAPDGETRYRWIAQAAYLRAERRGFAPGGEVDDWLAAEAEFLSLYGAK